MPGRLPTGSGEETVVGTGGRAAGFSGCVRLCGVAGFCGAEGFCGAPAFCGDPAFWGAPGFCGPEGFCDGVVEGGGAVIDTVAAAAGSLAR
jgi:hypothetical protein